MVKYQGDGIVLEAGDTIDLGDFTIAFDGVQDRLEFRDTAGGEAFLDKGASGDILVTGVEHDTLSGLGDDDHTQYLLVDGTRSMSGPLDLGANDLEDSGVTIWDTGNQQVPLARLEEDSITVSSGKGIKGGTTLQLGESTTLNVEPEDFAGTNLEDDGNDNLDAVFGQDYTNTHSETNADTSNVTSWTDYITLSTPTISGTNTYKINWNLVWFQGNQDGVAFRLRNKTDGTNVGELQGVEIGTSGYIGGNNFSSTFGASQNITLSSQKDFAIQYITVANNTTNDEIREGDIEFFRVN